MKKILLMTVSFFLLVSCAPPAAPDEIIPLVNTYSFDDFNYPLQVGDVLHVAGEGAAQTEAVTFENNVIVAVKWIQSSQGVFILNLMNSKPEEAEIGFGELFLESVTGPNDGERLFPLIPGDYYFDLERADGDWEVTITIQAIN